MYLLVYLYILLYFYCHILLKELEHPVIKLRIITRVVCSRMKYINRKIDRCSAVFFPSPTVAEIASETWFLSAAPASDPSKRNGKNPK